jgi:N,N'-diacetylchitobiose transport system substrate-binding protein
VVQTNRRAVDQALVGHGGPWDLFFDAVEGPFMKIRYIAAAVLAASLAVAASTAAGSTHKSAATSITVWTMGDWPEIVSAATAKFKQQHPDVDVKFEPQTWADHLTKLDASLAGGNAPDVIELGNSEMTKYMAAGAFSDLTSAKASFPNASTWVKAMTTSSTYNGKLYGVPYYGGVRAVLYRTDVYKKAGIKRAPKSLDEFMANGKKLLAKNSKDPNFSALYMPGKYWYAAMQWVYDYGGQIATLKGGKWAGALDSPKAVAGLTKWKQVISLSRADKAGDEAKQDNAFAQGHVAALIGLSWERGVITDKKTGNPNLEKSIGAYAMPSHVSGKTMPVFLGGSDLAVPATTKNKQLAIDWIKAFTSTESETAMAKLGVIPNTTSLLRVTATNPQLAGYAAAAQNTWFVPINPNWANVESSNVLQNMLSSIATGRSSVQKAATAASRQITSILNQS